MLGKKGLSIIIVAVFAIISLVVVFSIFNVKGVDATYTLYDVTEEKVDILETKLDKYVGKNLLFVNTDDIVEEIEEDAYMQVVSIEKEYPNRINVTVKERREVFVMDYNEQKYVLAENGFVLSEFTKTEYDSRDYIEINLEGVNITELTIGSDVKTDSDEIFYTSLSLAKEVNLTDCIDSFTVKAYTDEVGDEFVRLATVEFNTYTKVKIVIPRIDIRGAEKVCKAFEVYDSQERDYIKSSNEIHVTILQETDEIDAQWSRVTQDEFNG